MKNLTFLLAILCFSFIGISAQAGGNLDARVITVTRSMSAQLGLNEMDYIKLKALNYEHMSKAAEINSRYENDITMRDVKVSDLEKEYEQKLSALLNTKQMEAYVAYKENKKNFTAFSMEDF